MRSAKGWIRLPKNNLPECDFVDLFSACLPRQQILLAEPMSRHTTFAIGGPADCMVLPASPSEAAAVLQLTLRQKLPLTIIGNGSNLLVRDKGIRGLVLKVGQPMSQLQRDGDFILAGADR